MEKRNYFGENIHIGEGSSNPSEDSLRAFKELGETLSRCELWP